MRAKLRHVLALFFALLTSPPIGQGSPLLVEGGAVYTSSEATPKNASILLRDGKIAFVGDAARARQLQAGGERVNLAGAFVFPGWADAHGHLLGLGKSLEIANLRGAASAAEAARRIAELAARLPAGRWVEARGWDQNLWPGKTFPDARDLDAVVSDRPVAARRVDGHALWVNSAALEKAGIRTETPDPAGGRILRRPDSSPSGVLVDNAADLIDNVVPAPTPADLERRFVAAMKSCAKVGLTEVQDASGYGPEEIAVLERLAARHDLPIRVYATVSPEPEPLATFFAKGILVDRGGGFLTVRAIKGYADGALGSRGAALLGDYSDEPGKQGLLVTAPDRLNEIARQAREKGWQLWIHAIGDRGNRVALDAFRKAVPGGSAERRPRPDRPRIEHAQMIAPDDIPRFGREGVIASIQPTHATSDMPWAEARVGPLRIKGAYAWRTLKSSGARLAGGSDFPVESENPLYGFYAAITRQDLAGRPAGGWRPSERLTRREALALFTSDAAYAAFEEHVRGRIAPGFAGDLTVFAADPMTAVAKEIPTIPVVMTVVGGRVAYSRELGAEPGP
ncbi:MAG TPA: amidohydrolase [Thermoanaerobaculia bacterium]|nr:amidohydrolase [Thermoanaerobaculia bacterium]